MATVPTRVESWLVGAALAVAIRATSAAVMNEYCILMDIKMSRNLCLEKRVG